MNIRNVPRKQGKGMEEFPGVELCGQLFHDRALVPEQVLPKTIDVCKGLFRRVGARLPLGKLLGQGGRGAVSREGLVDQYAAAVQVTLT